MSDTEARVSVLPDCNFDAFGECPKAEYDFRTMGGSWAFGCKNHYEQYRMYNELGMGKGQRLISDIMAAQEEATSE
jgi:hypothetical protein